MAVVYIVILSFIALLLLFAACYLLAVLMNKAMASTEWGTVQEPTPAKMEKNIEECGELENT